MNTLSYKTLSTNSATAKKEWVVVDAAELPMGRVCSVVAKLIRGKFKPNFSPHVDCGDNVIVINADKAILTGRKWTDRKYVTYSGYPGGQRIHTPESIKREKGADRLFERSVRGMLPKNRLGRKLIKNLYVYPGEEHAHEAQQPRKIDVKSLI